jgi:superfamily II DNA or RNA helicase
MLHTSDTDRLPRHTHAPPALVRCRARTWRVLDTRMDEDHTTWRLARSAELPRLIASPPDEVVAVQSHVRRVSRRTWMRVVLAESRSSAPAWWPVTAARQPLTLLAWQCVPAMMILSGHHRRVLLADEVGMGKTVQAGILLHEIHAREPGAATLVVVPAVLVAQWSAELRARSRLEVSVLDATTLRAEAAQPQRVVDAARAGNCWLTSIDLVRQPDVIALVARTRWTLLVVDEAHLCAPGTARLDAVARVASSSARVLLLTASPTAAGAAGADRLRAFGARLGEAPMPVLRRDASRLARPRRRTCLLRVRLEDRHLALCARLDRFADRARYESGASGLLPALVLRRRASSSPAALIRSIERRLQVLGLVQSARPRPAGLFDDASQDEQDDELMSVGAWREEREERRELEHLLTLAREVPAGGGKLEAVARLVTRCRQPVVVFTAFLDTLRALRPLLAHHELVVVHGAQPDAARTEAIAAFTRGPAIVLLTTDASAEGLNLHSRCRLIVHAEVPSSARMLEQRSGRVDRYGQTRRVHAVVMASATVEDQQALARLSARASGDDEWLASTVQTRCRRTEVAERAFATWTPLGEGDVTSVEEPRQGDVPLLALRPRRWRRVATRLGLPATAQSVCLATLRASGRAELSATCLTACMVSPIPWLPWTATAACWPAPLRAAAVRARRLAKRLVSWEQDATRAAEHAATGNQPDLFAASTMHSSRDRAESRPDPVWLTIEPRAVASCTSPSPGATGRAHVAQTTVVEGSSR